MTNLERIYGNKIFILIRGIGQLFLYGIFRWSFCIAATPERVTVCVCVCLCVCGVCVCDVCVWCVCVCVWCMFVVFVCVFGVCVYGVCVCVPIRHVTLEIAPEAEGQQRYAELSH